MNKRMSVHKGLIRWGPQKTLTLYARSLGTTYDAAHRLTDIHDQQGNQLVTWAKNNT